MTRPLFASPIERRGGIFTVNDAKLVYATIVANAAASGSTHLDNEQSGTVTLFASVVVLLPGAVLQLRRLSGKVEEGFQLLEPRPACSGMV